jgi:hypothetical protein
MIGHWDLACVLSGIPGPVGVGGPLTCGWLVDLECLLSGSRHVAKCVATGGRSRVFAVIRGERKSAVTRGDAQARISADVLPMTGVKGSRVQISPARLNDRLHPT